MKMQRDRRFVVEAVYTRDWGRLGRAQASRPSSQISSIFDLAGDSAKEKPCLTSDATSRFALLYWPGAS